MSGASRIVIETRPGEIRAAVLDGTNNPIAFRIERETSQSLVGGIYLGRVLAVRPEIGAAFVDLGLGTDGFLNLKGGDTDACGTRIEEGAAILVQLTRDAEPGKGPALAAHIDFVGAALVLTPGKPGLGLSGRIEDEETRVRLKSLFTNHDFSDAGLVVRTDAADLPDAGISDEYVRLQARWGELRDAMGNVTAPACLIDPPGLSERLVSQYAGPGLSRILVDDGDMLTRLKTHIDNTLGDAAPAPEITNGGEAAFKAAEIEDAFEAALSDHVPLKGGGSLIITETPAMTTVDVNAGRAAAGNPERLALETNLEAAKALARELMLRGIGGLIAVDFLKMREEQNKKRVLGALNAAFRSDPDGPRTGTFSRFGIVDIVRRRNGASLSEMMMDRRSRQTPETAALGILDKIRRRGGTGSVLKCSPDVRARIEGPLANIRKNLEHRLGFVIRLEEVPGAAPDHAEIEDA